MYTPSLLSPAIFGLIPEPKRPADPALVEAAATKAKSKTKPNPGKPGDKPGKGATSIIPFLLIMSLFCSCSVGPDYKKPAVVDTPPDYRWKKAEPRDDHTKGNWWSVYHDSELDGLIKQAMANNQELRMAVARVEQSRARSRLTASDFFPHANVDANYTRQRTSANAPLPFPMKVPSMTYNSFSVPLDLSYEVDLWGRVRRSFEAAQAQAHGQAAAYQNVLLVLTADVASNYFLLRSYDTQIDVLKRTLEFRQKEVELQTKRFNAGSINDFDLSRAKTEKAIAQGDLADAQRRRAETEANLSLLCGQMASSFTVKEKSLDQIPPEVPTGLPSELLERRPDVAEAERTLAARNAEIGVAYAAFFPSVRLTGQGGYLSAETSDLFSWESRVWSFGPSISIPIFEGGRNTAQLKTARAAYDEAVAGYRQQVLVAFKDVEVALIQTRFYKEQGEANLEALQATRRSAYLADERYRRGLISYLDVIEVQRNLLNQELLTARLLGQRMVTSVRLIEALGGSWDQSGSAPDKASAGVKVGMVTP